MKLKSFFDFREKPDEPKPFLDHIEDLRVMLIKMIIVLGVMMAAAFIFQKTIIDIIMHPMLAIDPKAQLNPMNLSVTDPLTIAIELSFYAGIVMAFPFLVFFLAEFILPALTPQEKRMLYPVAAISLGLFLVGVLFAYFFVLPPTLQYFYDYSKSLNWNPNWAVKEYFSFTTQFVVSFGLAFELPLAVLLLVKLGIVSHELLNRTRSFAVVIILILAAVITPTTDMFTLFLMAVPMYLLYEACIVIAWVMERKERQKALVSKSD